MSDSDGFGVNRIMSPRLREANAGQPHPSAVGSPLPIGGGGAPPLPPVRGESQRFAAAPPSSRALANSLPSPRPPMNPPSGLQRVVGALRAALPFVQRILPLLDGNLGTAVSNALTPHHPTPPPSPPVNLEPIEDALAGLQSQHLDLRNRVVEQNASLKRVEDQLQLVREATDRNTLEQQELLQDLKGVRIKVNRFALIALALLTVSILLNLALYLHIQGVLP